MDENERLLEFLSSRDRRLQVVHPAAAPWPGFQTLALASARQFADNIFENLSDSAELQNIIHLTEAIGIEFPVGLAMLRVTEAITKSASENFENLIIQAMLPLAVALRCLYRQP